ncbi:MAG: murein biosynthesis integral membrane protein MurJ [Syntrophobacteraceae bacterium]|nr:murein biosynthesis integral membrane protein MurJ [Syntrophobacteraceae bacterium]
MRTLIPAGGFWSRTQGMGLAAVIMGLSILLSRFMGLIRDKVISYLFGATQEADIYFASFVIPDFINYLLAGGYFSITLIPLLSTFFEESDGQGWDFFSTVLIWITGAITLLTIICFILAPQLAQLAAPGLSEDAMERLGLFLRIILPAQICFLVGSCFSALLYMRKQFFIPALVPIVYNACIILGGVLWREHGMEGFCWGVLAGAVLGNLLLPYLACRTGEGMDLRLRFQHPGLKRFMRLALPLMLGQSIVVLDEQLVRVFGTMAGVGAVSWLNYARRIMLVPVGVVAQAAGVASYPFLAELFARKDWARFQETLGAALRNVLTLLIPISLWMALVSEPTVRLIFEQGSFAAEDTRKTALVLVILLSTVCFWGGQQILGRAFYARQDTVTPAVLGTLITLVSIPVFHGLNRLAGFYGVAAASALSIALYTVVLGVSWWWRFGGEAFRGLAGAALRVAAVAAPAALASCWIPPAMDSWLGSQPLVASFLSIVLTGFVFGVVFALTGRFVISDLLAPFARRLGPLGRIMQR